MTDEQLYKRINNDLENIINRAIDRGLAGEIGFVEGLFEEINKTIKKVTQEMIKEEMIKEEIQNIVSWYVECKTACKKVNSLYREWLDIGYNDPAYQELQNNYKKAYLDLKSCLKD